MHAAAVMLAAALGPGALRAQNHGAEHAAQSQIQHRTVMIVDTMTGQIDPASVRPLAEGEALPADGPYAAF